MDFVIKDPGDLRESDIARALRGDKGVEVLVLRDQPAHGRASAIRLGPISKRLQGQLVPIKMGDVELGVATLEVRQDGLYFTKITPTPAGAEWAKNPQIGPPPAQFIRSAEMAADPQISDALEERRQYLLSFPPKAQAMSTEGEGGQAKTSGCVFVFPPNTRPDGQVIMEGNELQPDGTFAPLEITITTTNGRMTFTHRNPMTEAEMNAWCLAHRFKYNVAVLDIPCVELIHEGPLEDRDLDALATLRRERLPVTVALKVRTI